MKKSTFLLLIVFVMAGNISAQTLPEGMVSVLPDGVKANISSTRKNTKDKNLVVAGEKSKGYKAFFAATDATHGEELWVTDGTPEGTRMVKDINPGSGSSDVNWLTRFNDKVIFGANDDVHGMELWISDGTEEGTHLVKDVHELGDASPRGMTQLNETQFIFCAMDFESENYSDRGKQWWLYVSDGTEAGTELIYECDTRFPGQDNASADAPYMRVGRKVFFKGDNKDGTVGEELWVTDGTREGTLFVMDINTETIATGTANSAIDNMVNFYNEKLFFKAFSIESNNEPWASDGTPEGTYEIYDSNPTFEESGFPRGGGASDCGILPYKGKIYFRGYSLELGCELACTNLDKGDFKIFDVATNVPSSDNHSYADIGVEFDGVYMFCANSGTDATIPTNYGGELYYTDGERVYLQSDLAPGTMHHWVKDLTVASGSLYWWNEGTTLEEQKQKLFRIDNKEQFPVRVTNLNADGDKIHSLRNLGGDIIFTTADDSKAVYVYHYRKEGYDPVRDADNLEIEFRTRAEIEGSSIASPDLRGKVAIYPNPASDIFHFDLDGTATEVTIFDLTGRIVKQEVPSGNSVSVASLISGVYKVRITTAEGSYISSLIVK